MNYCCRLGLSVLLWFSLVISSWAEVFDYPIASHPQAQQALQKLAAEVQQQGALSGHFVQTKNLQIMALPIISQGQFSLTKDAFVWSIETPFTIRYEFTGQALWRAMDGERQRIQPADEPLLYGFFSFFFSLFDLSEAALEKIFTIYFLPSASDNSWEMGLKPKQAVLTRSLQALKISGSGTNIQQVKLVEQSGDTTLLEFSYAPDNKQDTQTKVEHQTQSTIAAAPQDSSTP